MKNKRNQQSGKGILRRFLAKTLALTMVLSFLTPAAPMTAYASELAPENLGEQSCDSTIGTIYYDEHDEGKKEISFDIQGKRDQSTKYTASNAAGFNTTFRNNGYETYLSVDEGELKAVQCRTNGGVAVIDGIEVKMTVLPSPDNEYMFVNYYVYNRENTEKKVQLGSCADIQMDGHGVGADDPADTAALYKTDKGFYMQNTDNHSSFNLYTGESITGLKEPDTYWRGYFNDRKSYVFDKDGLDNQACVGMDSGLAYSWNITLHPHEMVHRRVAFSCRVNAYYVSCDWGDDDNNGTLLHPFETLERAIEKIGDRKGYIFIIDYDAIDAPIELSSQNCDITIQSSDYKADDDNYDDDATISPAKIEKEGDEDIRSLERATKYNGPLFKVTGGKLTFRQIDINGEKKESAGPLIEATGGTLTLGTAARVINAKGTAKDRGSAIDLRGSANFVMNGGRITGNESAEGGKGAVYYHSSGAFRVSNEVNIQDNKDRAGTPANATLAAGKTIAVEGDLKKGKIGITSETLPEVMPGSVPTAANQEIPVAKIGDSYQNPPITFPFADNFEADQKEKQGVGVYVGTKFTGSTDNRKYAVLRRNGYRINFVYADIRGRAVRGTKNRTQQFGAGEPVEENAPAPVTGYMLKEVKIEQGGRSALKAETSGTDMGKITGTMPAEDVTVTYLYEKQLGTIRFETNGGAPKPADIKGTIGSPVNGVFPGKNIAKRGYKFEGWIQGIYQPGSKTWRYPSQPYTYVSGLPTEFLPDPVAYYAMFTPDHSVKFDWTTAYQNQNGSIEFQTKITEKAYSVENPVAANQKPIKGYKWSPEDSRQMPSVFPFYREGNQEPTPFGSFDGNGHFSGIMPGQNASVIYRYKVDYSDPNGRSPLTVRYVTGSGGSEREVSTAFQQELYPEDSISVSPVNVFGYDLDPEHCRITAGDQADDRDGHLVSQVTGDFDSAGNYTGKMPNQPVEITYTYKPNGEGYRFQVRYEDMESEDSLLKEISSVTEKHPADANVKATYALPYGYRYAEQKAEPQAPEAQFDGAHNYTARMPVDDLTVTYRHQRDSSQWATIHYNGGRYGTLSHDNERPSDDPNKKVSPDVIKDHDGSYLTAVLKADNQGHGDTWADVKKKRLVPLVSLDSTNSESQYYRFAGWFIDADGDGVWDKNDDREKLISEDQTFAGATTLTAAFEEDPDKWVDVQLTAGDHGTLTENGTGNPISHPVTIHTRCDSKWGDLLLPNNKPEVNYLVRGWYDGARKMGENDSLRNGATYTLQFYPDPLVFGTNAGDVDAAGSLDEDGKGRVTAFDTKPGYRYFITDLDGTILDVQDGSVTGRTVFDKRCPGTRYLVYEAEGSSDAAPGMKAAEVRGAHGHPSEVLTPVVERNYQITYDTKHEDKTVLTIEPADRDADYALLDQNGHVVHTQESGADGWQTPVKKPGRVVFSGLDYNGVYTVVARPKGKSGVTAESKRPDGTELTMDPGGELEIPKFTVKTVNGTVKTVGEHTVNGEEYEEAHRGDSVRVSAEAENDAGQRFRAWRVLVGAVSGLGAKLRALVFDFTMPDTNVVFSAEYERSRQSSPSNARVTDEVRGGNPGEMALDPKEVSGLEESLTTPKDRELMDVNHADVTYKVVYQKGRVKATVSNALRNFNGYENYLHKSAYTEAWDLGVLIERYVNGRRVGRTTPSDAAFNTYVQLDREDVDMMDYVLYQYRKDPDHPGKYLVDQVDTVGDPEETGGLFQFTARPDTHYVLTYSKAYHLTFLNEHSRSQPKHDFKVRKGEAPSDSTYETDYEKLEQPEPHMTDDQGIEYHFEDWSRRRDKLKAFDADQPIQKRTYVYAYYKDNGSEVRNTRKQLDDAIREAARRADDFFLKRKETGEILDAVKEALAVFDRTPGATAPELQKALDTLKRFLEPYDRTLDKRYDHYGRINTERNVGGSGGGGGGRGAGVQASPFVPESPKSYVVGTNGSWELLNAEKQEWAFVLNGGIRLVGRWGKLDYANGDVNRNGWYHFNAHGIMDSGWFLDEAGNWYYCNTAHDGWFGKMKTGWHYDRDDSRWYYLDPVTGRMATGWVQIGGKWYYFAPHTEGSAWAYDGAAEKWFYLDNKRRPFGSLYQNETTPDQYRVDGDGAWVK